MKKIGVILILILTVSRAFTQNIDSLFVLYTGVNDGRRVELANELLQTLEVQKHARDVVVITGKTSKEQMEIEVNIWMGNYKFRIEQYTTAIDFFDKSIAFSLQTGDSIKLEMSYYMKGFCYQRLGNIDLAIQYNILALEIDEMFGNSERMSSVMNNIANIYQTNNQDSMAIEYYRKSLDIERRQDDPTRTSIRLGNMSASYLKIGKINEALDAATEGLALERTGSRPYNLVARLTQLAEVYMAMKNYDDTEKCIHEALIYFEDNQSLYGMAICYNMLGEIKGYTGQLEQANILFEKAVDCAEKNENRYVLMKIAKNIYLLNKEQNPKLSLHYHELYTVIQDSIFGKETRQLLAEFQVKYETAEKELELERRNSIINQQHTQRHTLIAGTAVCVVVLLSLWYMLRLRIRHNRVLAKHNNTLTEANDALAEANATKDKFFSIISHDLKNPAVAQRDALQLFADAAGEWDNAALSDYAQKLLKSADGQVILLNNLLNWAQIQTGSMPYIPVEFELIEAIRPDVAIVRNLADRKGIAFETLLPPAAPVAGDDKMLCTVIRNLLSNAVKFTPAGGKVMLEVSPTLPDEVKKESPSLTPPLREGVGGRLLISITDTGIGMPPEQIQNLYKIDRRHSSRGTSGEQGSGLGLIVCKELLEKHGITLSVESEPGKGSRFWFQV